MTFNSGIAKSSVAMVVGLAVLVGCAPIDKKMQEGMRKSGVIEIAVVSSPVAYEFPALPKRPTAGEGAVAGAFEGAGAVFESSDPYAFILLPIMIPLGALFGAASVPNDEQWAEVEHRYGVMSRTQSRFHAEIGKRNVGRDVQRAFVAAVRDKAEVQGICVRTSDRPRDCGGRTDVSKVTLRLRPVLDLGGYVLDTAMLAELPGSDDPACSQLRLSRSYLVPVVTGKMTMSEALQTVREMNDAAAGLLAIQLLDAPGEAQQAAHTEFFRTYGYAGAIGELPCARSGA